MLSPYRNWFSAVLFTVALAGYTQLATQPAMEPLPVAFSVNASAIAPTGSAVEPLSSAHPTPLMSCEGIQLLPCAYINREVVERLSARLWSATPVAESQTRSAVETAAVETTATPASFHLGETIKFLTTCKNWIESYSVVSDAPHHSRYEGSIALSVEE